MKLFKSKAESAQAATTNDAGEVSVDENTEATLLEQHIDEERKADPAAFAAEELGNFEMTAGARSLLDRALDNLSKNKGEGLPEDAQLDARLRAELIDAAGNDLSVVLDVLTAEVDKPTQVPGLVYSICYNVLRAAVFIANTDYRRALDPNQDMDLVLYADRREEEVDPPMGYQTRGEWLLEQLKQLYGQGNIELPEDCIPAALEDLRLFLQLTVESFGWDPERTMPFAVVQEPNGTFTHINDPMTALDNQELKRQMSRKKRRDETNKALAAAAEAAREKVKQALARRAV